MSVSAIFEPLRFVPYIALSGKWLEEMGFGIGTRIRVDGDYGRLAITQDYEAKTNTQEQELPQMKGTNSLEGIVQSPTIHTKRQKSSYQRDYRGYTVWLRLERDIEYEPIELSSPADVYRFLKPLEHESREVGLSIMLDTKHQVVGVYEVGKGTRGHANMYPFEILKSALVANSSSIILAHNHPSGNSEPSQDDINITKQVVEVSKPMGITLLDHIIIGFNNYKSLKELGHL